MFRYGFLSAVLLVFALQFPCCANSAQVGLPDALSELVGEDYRYAIDFLFFKRLAEGELRLVETARPNVYRAELIGRTLGIASWLSGERTQTYRSWMELLPDGSLSSIKHVASIKKKKWGRWRLREKVRRFEYALGKVVEEKYKEGVANSSKEHDIPKDLHPVDMLTAFYNLRLGVYGHLKRGSKILIPTFSGKGFAEIEVSVLTHAEQRENSYFPSHGLLLQAKIDPEIFETDSGNLYIWFDEQGTPGRGIVEDMIGLGDVRGYLDDKEGQ